MAQLAVLTDNLDLLRLLIQNSDDKQNIINGAFLIASKSGKLDIVKYLLDQGADINYPDGQPLLFASEEGQLNVVRYLVENGADVNGINENYLSPIEFAAESGHLDVVKYLVQNGATNPDHITKAIMRASAYRKTDVVQYLESL